MMVLTDVAHFLSEAFTVVDGIVTAIPWWVAIAYTPFHIVLCIWLFDGGISDLRDKKRERDRLRALRARRRARSNPGPGRIVYKKANVAEMRILDARGRRIRLVFQGVGPELSYAANESKAPDTPGFHGYNTVDDAISHPAISHPQAETVILEALLSHGVDVHARGAIGDRQRVLQVLIDPEDLSEKDDWRVLVGHTWTDQHGTRIVFAPLREAKVGRIVYRPFVPTRCSDSREAAAA